MPPFHRILKKNTNPSFQAHSLMYGLVMAYLMIGMIWSPPIWAQQYAEPATTQNRGEQEEAELNLVKLAKFKLKINSNRLNNVLEEHLPAFSSNAEAQVITPSTVRKLENDITSILATEGYFSPVIQTQANTTTTLYEVKVEQGPRTRIGQVIINITGALENQVMNNDEKSKTLKRQLIESWDLSVGDPFRQEYWDQAKLQLLEKARSEIYVSATIVNSKASIDAEKHTALLEIDLDSGPPFVFGDIQVSGLERYPLWVVDRYHPPKRGEPYSLERLLQFQKEIQSAPFFSMVAFNVEPDPTKALAVPIELSVTERKTIDVDLGLGYSNNTGLRTELNYRDRNLFNRLWDLRSTLRFEQKSTFVYADVFFPPNESNINDAFGALRYLSKYEKLYQLRYGVGVKRIFMQGKDEKYLQLNAIKEKVIENFSTRQANERKTQALVLSTGAIWRKTDNLVDPRQGYRLQLDLATAVKAVVSDANFSRVYVNYNRWMPFNKLDNLKFNLKFGQVLSKATEGIPEEYLFRIGGVDSVRGYGYQSIGINKGQAVVGGKVMSSMSVEYVKYLEPTYGVAVFADAGGVANQWRDMTLKQGIGTGLRVKTPAGPIAVDVSYGRQSQNRKFRLDLWIALTF